MYAMWFLLAMLFGAHRNVVAETIITSVEARPQAPAISPSATETASVSVISSVVIPTTFPLSNTTTQGPPLASGCSANCTFTLPNSYSGTWTRCAGVYNAGQVKHIVNKATNKTTITTIYTGKITYTINETATTAEASDVMRNGSFVYSRTDVNDAGTVTVQRIGDGLDETSTATIAYPTAQARFPHDYNWRGVVPYAANDTTECVTATEGSYPLPTDVILPTRPVGALDTKDPRGLSYCYHGGYESGISDEDVWYWSLYSDTMLDVLRNDCSGVASAAAPVIAVQQATFLLETTTDFIDEPETQSPTKSPSTKVKPTPSDVLVDPFQSTLQSEDEQKSSQSESKIGPGPTVRPPSPTVTKPKETIPAPDRTTSATKQSLEASVAPADQNDTPSSDDDEPEPSRSLGAKPTAPANVGPESNGARPTAPANDESDSGNQPAASPKTSQLDVLNSLIQEVGQQQTSASPAAPTITLNGFTATPDSSAEYVLDGHILKPGGSVITISGTQISLASGASAVVVGSRTSVLVASGSPADRVQAGSPAPVLTLGDATAALNSASEYVVGEQTLEPGGPAITLSGTPISLVPQATAVVVGSSTSPIATVPHRGDQAQQFGVQSAEKLAPLLTLAGATATLNSDSEYVIGDQTLKPGASAITVSGTPISLALQATAVVVGSSTSILVNAADGGGQARKIGKLAPLLTLADATATLNSASAYVVEGRTLLPGGPAITLSGTRISLASHATEVVIGSTTSALKAASSGIGDYVWAGIAGVLAAAEAKTTPSPGASETQPRSEVVVTSTANDGEVVVKTVVTAKPASSSPSDSVTSSAGTSSRASDGASSSAEASDVPSPASSTKSGVDAAALICWIGFFMMFG